MKKCPHVCPLLVLFEQNLPFYLNFPGQPGVELTEGIGRAHHYEAKE